MLQPATVCLNGSTLAANQARGLDLRIMLTAASAPMQWIAASCLARPASVGPIVADGAAG